MISHIIKKTFIELKNKGLQATPKEYKKEFCSIAKKMGLYTYECNEINSLHDTISKKNSEKIKELNISSMDELLIYIEKSMNTSLENTDLQALICVVSDALHPSLGSIINDEIDSFNKNILNNPEQLSKKDTQKRIHELFELRCELDKNIMSSKTKQLIKTLASVTKEFTNTLIATNNSNTKIMEIRKNIENINTESINDADISNIKNDMLTISKTFEDETKKFADKLEKDSSVISKMTKKIEQLETNLQNAKHDSVTDFLTGAKTRRGFDQYIKDIDLDFVDHNVNYSLIYFDIDYFKKINDEHGHDVGDTVLVTFVKLLLHEIGNEGEVFRFGGEEFISILPNKNSTEGYHIAEKIRGRVERSNFIHDDIKLNITISAGVSQRSSCQNIENLITNADNLVYQAKQNGRNQIVS